MVKIKFKITTRELLTQQIANPKNDFKKLKEHIDTINNLIETTNKQISLMQLTLNDLRVLNLPVTVYQGLSRVEEPVSLSYWTKVLSGNLESLRMILQTSNQSEIYLKEKCDCCGFYVNEYYEIDEKKYCQDCYEAQIKPDKVSIKYKGDGKNAN